MESKIHSMWVSPNTNSINSKNTNHSITEEIETLQALFTNQTKQLQEISEKLLDYQEQNKRLKQRIADHYNKKLIDSLTKLNLTQKDLIEYTEFLGKIENEPVRFENLFNSIESYEDISPLVHKFFKISYTVMNI